MLDFLKKHSLLGLVLVGILWAQPCQGQDTGAKVMTYCALTIRGLNGYPATELRDVVDSATCIGMIHGVEGTLIRVEGIDRLLHTSLANTACLPEGYSSGQGVRIAFKFMQEHPERLHEAGVALIYDALTEAFPCKAESATTQ